MSVFSEKTAEKLLRTSLELGVNFLDTGAVYSRGNAEARLGRILRGDYDKLILATKVGSTFSPRGRIVKDFSLRGMESTLASSLKKLKTDSVGLLQLHSPPKDALNDDVLNGLESFKKRGMARFLGISTDSTTAEKATNLGIFDSLMITYNIVTRDSSRIIERAHAKGMAVLVKSPLSHAVFSNEMFRITRPSKLWYLLRILKNFRSRIRPGRKLRFINTCEGWTGAEVALKYVLSNRAVTSAVMGTTNMAHLKSNLNVSFREDLPMDLVERIEST